MSFRKLSFFFWDGYESSSFLFCNGFLNGSWAFVLFGLGVLWVHGRRHWKPEMVNCDTARKCLRLDSLEIPEMFSSLAWKQKSPRSGAYRLVMRVLSVCPFPILSLKDTFNWCVWVYICVLYMCAWYSQGHQKRASESLELELWVVVTEVWVLRIDWVPTTREASDLTAKIPL